MASNEAALCEKVIVSLEEQLGAARADVSHPEQDGSGPPVEIRLSIGDRRFAIEHTLIEPFDKHIHGGVDFEAFGAPLRLALDGTMPGPGTYKLFFDLNPAAGIPRSKHDKLRQKIAAWVAQAASELVADAPPRRSRAWAPFGDKASRETTIDGVKVMLTRHVSWSQSGVHDGRIFLSRMLPKGANVELMRASTAARAQGEMPKARRLRSARR